MVVKVNPKRYDWFNADRRRCERLLVPNRPLWRVPYGIPGLRGGLG